MRQRVASARERFRQRASIYHQRFLTDVLILAVLLFSMGCTWFHVGRWICLGAILMFLPKFFTDTGRLLDVELLRDRLGMQPTLHGRHSGKHPRPGARNKA